MLWSFPLWLAIAAEAWTVTRAFGIEHAVHRLVPAAGAARHRRGGADARRRRQLHEAYRFGVTTFFGAPNDQAVAAAIVVARDLVRAGRFCWGIVFMAQDGLSFGRLEGSGQRGSSRRRKCLTPMKCPFCGHLGDKVVDSRESKEGEVIRRRRECLDCGRRFTSYERIDEIPYMVIKKDGTRERFERQKLIAGLLKACEKRPVSIAAIEAVADKVEATLQERPEKEMATEEVGALVMDELKRLDKVAYVRFASVYRHFRDIGEFMSELKDLLNAKE